MPMMGGHSDVKDVDDEIKDTLVAFKASIEEKAATTFETFVPVKYTKQVVAGMIYHIKVNVGNEFIHARVFQPLPHPHWRASTMPSSFTRTDRGQRNGLRDVTEGLIKYKSH